MEFSVHQGEYCLHTNFNGCNFVVAWFLSLKIIIIRIGSMLYMYFLQRQTATTPSETCDSSSEGTSIGVRDDMIMGL